VKARIVWADPVRDLALSLPSKDQQELFGKIALLAYFPHMYPVRAKSRHFRRHRCFHTENWLVYYRVVDDTVYIRGLWPARIP
jgi:hypothetical protein